MEDARGIRREHLEKEVASEEVAHEISTTTTHTAPTTFYATPDGATNGD